MIDRRYRRCHGDLSSGTAQAHMDPDRLWEIGRSRRLSGCSPKLVLISSIVIFWLMLSKPML